jgi:hypothetical protein
MDRAKFLARIHGAAVKLTPFTVPGWDEPVYLRPNTMADIKEQLLRGDEPAEIGARLKADPFYIERSVARLVRDEKGALLFDPADDAQMAELKAALDASPPGISRQIQDAQSSLNEPAKEVDPKGN